MNDPEYESGKAQGEKWMTELLTRHNRLEARRRLKVKRDLRRRAGVGGVSSVDEGFIDGASEALKVAQLI
jgi:hypothetical protein